MDTILVTGVAGFIGSNLCRKLLDTGYKVVGLDNFDPFYDRRIKQQNISGFLSDNYFTFVEGDIRDPVVLSEIFIQHKPGLVIHLAAKTGVRPSIHDPAGYYDVNAMGTLHLLNMMQQNGVTRMIFSSSSSLYGNSRKVPFSESDPVDTPVSPYAASKKSAELICYTYSFLYDFDITCLRLFTVYGPGQRPDLAIHKFTHALFGSEPIPVYGDGSTGRDYTHITDILSGIMACLSNMGGYRIYNLGNAGMVTLTRLITLLEKHTGRKALTRFLPRQAGDVDLTSADISKATEELGYSPRISIDDGIRDFVGWYQERYSGSSAL